MEQQRINIMQDEPAIVAVDQKPQEPKVEYAAVSERFVELLIDYGVIFLPCRFIGEWLLKTFRPEWDLWHYIAANLAINVLFILYETVFSCGDRMTLGKALVGIAVVKKDLSGPISFVRAFFRAIGYYISGILLLGGFLIAFFDDKHRALHDVFGGSVVVQIRQKSAAERMLLRFLGSLLLITFAWTVYVQFFGAGALVDKYYVSQAQKHLKKIALLEEGHRAQYGYYTHDLLRLSLLSGDPVQFQRDTQKILEPKGFKIGVKENTYKISAYAKDKKHTQVVFAPPER